MRLPCLLLLLALCLPSPCRGAARRAIRGAIGTGIRTKEAFIRGATGEARTSGGAVSRPRRSLLPLLDQLHHRLLAILGRPGQEAPGGGHHGHPEGNPGHPDNPAQPGNPLGSLQQPFGVAAPPPQGRPLHPLVTIYNPTREHVYGQPQLTIPPTVPALPTITTPNPPPTLPTSSDRPTPLTTRPANSGTKETESSSPTQPTPSSSPMMGLPSSPMLPSSLELPTSLELSSSLSHSSSLELPPLYREHIKEHTHSKGDKETTPAKTTALPPPSPAQPPSHPSLAPIRLHYSSLPPPSLAYRSTIHYPGREAGMPGFSPPPSTGWLPPAHRRPLAQPLAIQPLPVRRPLNLAQPRHQAKLHNHLLPSQSHLLPHSPHALPPSQRPSLPLPPALYNSLFPPMEWLPPSPAAFPRTPRRSHLGSSPLPPSTSRMLPTSPAQ